MFRVRSLLLAAGLLAAVPAAAQPADADLRCLVVGYALASSAEAEHRAAAIPFSTYYLGRVDGQGAPADLQDRLGDLASAMTADEVVSEAKRCGTAYQARAADLQAIGRALQERARVAE